MVQLLEEIQQRAATETNFFDDRRSELQKQLAQLTPQQVNQRIYVMFMLADEQLQVGDTQSAIATLGRCLKLVPKSSTTAQLPAGELHNEIEYQLAVAYLRLAEDENCVQCCNGESCLLPIRGGGIHQFPTGSQNAITHLENVLAREPGHLAARWLLNLCFMTLGRHPQDVPRQFLIRPEVYQSEEQFPRFQNVAKERKLDELSLAGGVVVDDLNGDGTLDLVTSNWSTSGQLRCYLANRDGAFEDVTEDSGLAGLYGGLNLIQGDYDNDGDVDLFVQRGAWLGESGQHPNSLLANDGQGHFRDVTFESGLGQKHLPTQTAAWADYDNDGDLDLYVGNEQTPCQLFENDGQGRFTDVAAQAGVTNGGYTKGVVWGDFDSDRFPDLYVSNLDGDNRLYRNNRDGTFTDVAATVGVADPQMSFPTWFWDFDNDGALDIYVAAYAWDVKNFAADYLGQPHSAETDRLYRGDGKGRFQDVSKKVKLARVTQPMGANCGDLDNDGFLDIYLGTGAPDFDMLLPNRMFHNQQGRRFTDVTSAGGFGHLQKGHGVAFADFDQDGDQDVFINMGGAYPSDGFTNCLFENPGFGNHWLAIRLTGKQSNRSAIGARIHAQFEEGGTLRSVYRWITSGGSFGANPLQAHLGLGASKVVKRLEIYWPTSDTRQVYHQIPADQSIRIVEGSDQWQSL